MIKQYSLLTSITIIGILLAACQANNQATDAVADSTNQATISSSATNSTPNSDQPTTSSTTENSNSYRPGETGQQSAQSGTVAYTEQEISLTSNGKRVWGKAYIPESEGPHPLVIFAHELGTSHRTGTKYAEYFASRGIAYYVFDFPGGSIGANNSEGSSLDMSVMTEAVDLENIVTEARTWSFVNPEKIYLHGGSQGGMVAAVTASRIPNQIAGLVLAYPAFIIPDQLHQDFGQLSQIPDTFRYIGWIDVSRRYAEDVWDYDVYQEIKAYTGPVLILHGNRDNTVPMRYAEQAQSAYANASLRVILNGGHEFFGEAFNQATQEMTNFFTQEGVLH